MSKIFETHEQALISLGFAFYGKVPRKSADPEKTILEILPALTEDRKLFRMLLTWLEIVSDLVHVERLKSLSDNLDPELKVVLGGIALKLMPTDRRWKSVLEAIRPKAKSVKFEVPVELRDPYLVDKYGLDEEYAQFGIKMARILPEADKKILSLEGILKVNFWLRLRALMGANFRADIAYLYLSGAVDGPSAAAKVLDCARDTAYRNWKALDAANVRKMVRLSA
jgi:hypothetical protein